MAGVIQDAITVLVVGGFVLLVYSKFTNQTIEEAFNKLKDSLFGGKEEKEE